MRYLTIQNYKKLEDVLNDTDEYITIYEHENVYNIYVTLKVLRDNFETKMGKIAIKVWRESDTDGDYEIVIESKVKEEYTMSINSFRSIESMRDLIREISRMLVNRNDILYV